jgi:hypothetical protein
MTYRFILVNETKIHSREEISTIDRKFGDIFLQDSLGRLAPKYSGYISMPNHISLTAMWILDSGAVGPLKVALHNLKNTGYMGEIWKTQRTSGTTLESVRIA